MWKYLFQNFLPRVGLVHLITFFFFICSLSCSSSFGSRGGAAVRALSANLASFFDRSLPELLIIMKHLIATFMNIFDYG